MHLQLHLLVCLFVGAPHGLSRVSSRASIAMGPQAGVATRVNDALVAEALSYFVSDKPDECKVTPTSGGVNNMVQYVDLPSGTRLVLRIYNNGQNTARVLFEHAVLRQLGEMGPFSFEIPRYLPSLTTGETAMLLKNGAMACISQLIPGGLPKTADPEPIGRATGELLAALGQIRLDIASPTPPYYDVYGVHKAVTKESFYEYVNGPELDVCRPAMARLTEEFRYLDEALAKLTAQELPKQLIHGDLHYDNVLFDYANGAVSGLLDFEFSAFDWRAMELAVCLSKYVGEKEPFPLVRKFIQGFCEYGRLSRAECEGLPEMINLRVMSNAVYFVGRALALEDTIDSLTSRADMYATRMEWVRNNRLLIVDFLCGLMREKSGGADF